MGDAVEEVDRAVDRVDDPGEPALARAATALLAEEAVERTRLREPRADERLAVAVDLRHDVDGRRLAVGDLDARAPRLDDERPGLPGDLDREAEEVGVGRGG